MNWFLCDDRSLVEITSFLIFTYKIIKCIKTYKTNKKKENI